MRSTLLVLAFLLTAGSSFAQPDFYAKRWSDVYKYELKALPKSALGVVDTIYIRAKREKNIPQLTKTLLYQSKFVLALEEDAELHIVQKFKKEISESKAPLKNILESILANIYWQYFRENSWKYYQRSRTAEKINAQDFRTWDSGTMFLEIHQHYQNSLHDAALLQKISLAGISDILTHAENSERYRPTVYDLLAHNALDFYQAGENLVTKPVTNFVLNDVRYFEEFEKLVVSSPDSLSPHLQALKIFQDLLSFHKKTKDTTAYVNLEIERLQFLTEEGSFENATDLHKKALARIKATYKTHPASTLLDFELASMLMKEGNDYKPKLRPQNQFKKREALAICDGAIAGFPESDGAEKCSMLKENILNEALELTAERYIPVEVPSRILVEYTNIDSLSFAAFRITREFEERFEQSMNDSLRLATLEKLTPAIRWQVGLKNLQDHQAHSTEVIVPKLSAGRYLLFARVEHSANRSAEATIAYTTIQITNLALLENALPDRYRFQVVDRNTGKPLEGADVHFKMNTTNASIEKIDQHFTTSRDGFFEIRKQDRYYPGIEATVSYQQDQAVFGEYYISNAYGREENEDKSFTARSFLFSDRSIYRPGQTVYFKGILIKTKGEKSSVVSGQYVEVFMEDVNGDEVGLLRLKTNSFGSFSGEFKLPASGLTGEYRLYADEDSEHDSNFYDNIDDFRYDELYISVEEYKRPTFEASFKPVKESFKLNDTITVKGTAMAYNGAKISGAKIRYHVTRNVRYPHWYYWSSRNHYSEAEEIASGEGMTDQEGVFSIDFNALADETVSKDERPVFHYEVTVDVTDINGETRSATTTVKAGYHTLLATLNAPALIDRKIPMNTISVTTENLNGQPVSAKGTIRIYKLESPSAPMRPRPWSAPDLPMITAEEFKALFPHDPYEDDNDQNKWKKGKLMADVSFNTEVTKEVKFKVDRSWELGSYWMELETTDPSGEKVTDVHRFNVFDPDSKAVADNQLLIFELNKPSYNVGELARLKIGSASPDLTVTIDIEKNHKIVKTYVEHLSGNVKEITIPVSDNINNGFAIHCSVTGYNTFLYRKKIVPVVSEIEHLEIETITFKDKLQPGSKETWSFEIKGSDPMKKESEILASMYDASLDQFKQHEWYFNPIQRRMYYSYDQTSGSRSFGERSFTVRNKNQRFFTIPRQYFDQLDWFGFSITDNYYANQNYMQRLYSSGVYADNPSRVTILNNKNLRGGYVYGRITDSHGEPLPAVNIVIKGTAMGTSTDAQGNYTIAVDKGEVLVYSFIGYAMAEAKVGRKNTINVTMEEDVTALSEIVVTAYGIAVEKKMLSYAVTEVMSDSTAGEVAFSSIRGKLSGVQITGMPGGAARLVIRGNSTASGAEPIYVVDGVVVESSTIDQGDLAAVQVLKGAAATALYGARAANGVIVIATKSGQKKLDEELAKITVRKNFNETAFFFPHLTTDENGRVRFTFTTPEALTRWKLQLLAHTRDLVTATKTLQTVTQKELMVTPNAPRFLRVGDDIVFSAKIVNLSGQNREGKVALQLSNAVTGEPVDQIFKNLIRNQSFKVKAKGSTEVSWKLHIPPGVDAVQYKVVAKAGNFSDGEQNALPVLSNRTLVTETLPMYVRSGETKTFTLDKLKTTTSSTLQHHQLTLEITSNPAWYAVQALPYLMEFPHECAEQIFSRYYANTLASHIANSNPGIREVFDKWSSTDALVSNLEKNQELKSTIIQETPWLRDAQSESEQKKRLALLFELNTMKSQWQTAITKLEAMQMSNGGFPWFSGERYPNRYITQHIASGFGHLKQLKVLPADDNAVEIINKAVAFLDGEIAADYNRLLEQANTIRLQAKTDQEGIKLSKEFMEHQHVYDNQVHYLYMRSFFQDTPLDGQVGTAVDYYRRQSAQYWKEFSLYMKGMIALVHHRNQNTALSKDIMRSLKENSITTGEMGMYWKENKAGWYWNEAPIETQALLIEAFSEIEAADVNLSAEEKLKTLDELRVWLLKNKQTSQWKTTKATTEAIYALLLNGTEWLSINDQVEVAIGAKKIGPDAKQQPEAGTGYFKTSWKGDAITSAMSEVTLTKKEKGIAWGGLYWQYFEELDKITPAETPLKLTKKVFVVSRTDKGELLTEVNTQGPLKVGDLLRVRMELSADRPMEFLHMKDMRAAGLEPVDVLSEYKWQEGLGYYQSTKDASTNFFFTSVPKGVYVFEYDLRVNNKGIFSNGITTIQSMYAPEFSSHSEGIRIIIE